MRRFRLLLLLIGIVVPSFFYAQDKQKGNAVQGSDAEYAFEQLEVKPEFPNGNEGLAKYLSDNIKYPKKALKNSITGKVFVQFVIDKTGKILDN